MNPVARTPRRFSGSISVLAGCVALGSGGLYSWSALVVGVFGITLLAVGVVRGTHRTVTAGAFGLFVGAMLSGIGGAPVASVLMSVTLAVVAWDVGGNAISIGEQLGAEAETIRIEIVHAAASLTVGVVTAAVGYGLYLLGSGEQSVVALVFLLIAAVLLIEVLS